MTVLQVAGEDESWDILDGSVNTTAGFFRAGYARCAIHSNSEDGVQIIIRGDAAVYLAAQPAGDKDIWVGYRFRGGGGFLSGKIGLKIYDSTDKCFLRLIGSGPGDQKMQTSDDGSFAGAHLADYPASTAVQPSGPVQWAFRIKVHPTLGHIAWYINDAFWFQTPVGDTTGLVSGSPKFLRFGCPNSNGNADYSELMITSADDPVVGKSLVSMPPESDGLTGWAGGFGNVGEVVKDTATQNTTAVAATDVTYGVGNIPALSGSVVIRAVCVSAEDATSSTPGTPQNVNQLLRIGGVTYPGATKAVGLVLSNIQTFWHTSPVDGTGFTEAVANALEVGQRSAA